MEVRRLVGAAGGSRVPGCARLLGALATLVAVLGVAGCDCGEAARSIPCASDSHCPRPLVCLDRVCQAPPAFPYDPEFCRATPEAEGCPCRDADEIRCYDGPAGTLDIGVCRSGARTCDGGRWGACAGQVVPGIDYCDDLDDDCDGETDEGVLNRCGTCSASCDRTAVPREALAPDGPGAVGVARGDDGAITLGSVTISAPYLWVANDGEETVSKVDAASGREVGRYVSGPPQAVSDRPSRTTVDLLGDAYVANRAFGGQGSVTKFAGQADRCVDRDGDGRIQTASDADGDGFFAPDEVLPWGTDECVLWDVPVGPYDAVPRALAIDAGDEGSAQGYVWVGTYFRGAGTAAGAAYRLRAGDGTLVGTQVDLPPDFNPYGAAVDCRGLLWLQQSGTVGDLAAVDTRRGEMLRGPAAPDGRIVRPSGPGDCKGAYGMTVDGAGRVWQAGSRCEDAWRYTPGREDPTAGAWERVDLSGVGGRPIGIAADLVGRVWVTGYRSEAEGGGVLAAIDGEAAPPRLLSSVRLLGASGAVAGSPKGVGVDPYGKIWVITQENSCRTPAGDPTGCAVRHDPDTGAVDFHSVGSSPYTYSDFLGFVARNFTARQGFFRTALSVCRIAVERWGEMDVDAEAPPGSRIRVRVRAADSVSAIDAAPWSPWRTWTGAPLDVQDMLDDAGGVGGRFLQVEFELGFDPGATGAGEGLCPPAGAPPRVLGVTAYAECRLVVG